MAAPKTRAEITHEMWCLDFICGILRPDRWNRNSPSRMFVTMQTVRTAVIGVGYLGRFHAQKYATLPRSRLVAVVDADPEVRGRVAAEVGCRAVGDFREILGEVEAVSIATPTETHHAVARVFLERGKHVLVEKPITNDVNKAEELVVLARKNDCVLQVGHVERFNPVMRYLNEVLTEARFIEVHRLSSYPGRSIDIGVVLDLMIHDLDVVLSLVKSPLANTMPPRACKRRGPSAVSQSIATTRSFSDTSAVARVPYMIVTPARRAAFARWVMKAREFGKTLCMRGLLCGGSGIGP